MSTDEFPARWRIVGDRYVLIHAQDGFPARYPRHREFLAVMDVPVGALQHEEVAALSEGIRIPPGASYHQGGGFPYPAKFLDVMYQSYTAQEKLKEANKAEFYYEIDSPSRQDGRFFLLVDDRLHTAVEKRVRFGPKPGDKELKQHYGFSAIYGRYYIDVPRPKGPQHSIGVWYQDWKSRGEWSLQERIPSLFLESFHLYLQGKNYFFVTDSGKLYISPPGQPRAMKELWTEKDRPLVAALTDGATKKTFLLGRNLKAKGAEARDFYFELAEQPKVQEYLRRDLPRIKANEPLKSLFQYAQLLANEKKLSLGKAKR